MVLIFSIVNLWTGLTFLLSNSPYNYNTKTIGLFGLIGTAGALSANMSGRLGDKGYAKLMTMIFSILLFFSWIILIEGRNLLFPIILGIFIVDIAVQGLQVTHQSILYKINTSISSRVTSIFITSSFIGMSLGSALSSIAYKMGGWTGICVIGCSSGLILIISIVFKTLLNKKTINIYQ